LSVSPGTDAAAQASAAFSSCSALYSGASFSYSNPNISFSPAHASLQNSSYASTLLNHASQLYSFALNASGGQVTYQTSVPTSAAAYGSSSFTDELVLAQMFLGLASNSSENVEKGQDMYGQFKLGGGDSVFNWDSKTPGLAVLGVQLAASGRGGNREEWAEEAERYFDRIVNGSSQGFLTKGRKYRLSGRDGPYSSDVCAGGLLWYNGESDDASLNPALNAAMLMVRYAPLASTSEKSRSYLVRTW
jgi:endoglucanase